MSDPSQDVMTAGVAMLGRTGAANVQIRYCDEEEPTVWMVVVQYDRPGGAYFETAAGMDPTTAVLRLCEQVIDGGQCTHCKRPTGLDANWQNPPLLDELVCWYLYDPENKTFRRGCEGS